MGYGVNLAEAVNVIEQAVESCESVRDDEPIQIFPHAFGDSRMEVHFPQRTLTFSQPLAIQVEEPSAQRPD